MKIIVEGKANVIKLLGKQQVKDSEYRLMKYVMRVTCPEGLLLHNVITGQMVLLDKEEGRQIDHFSTGYGESIEKLIEKYYLVPIAFDETKLVNELRMLMKRLFVPKGINNYVIFTTTDCNARCFYCFESECRRITMNESTGKELIHYMIANKGEGDLKLRWFGGEPLIGIQRIDQVCSELNSREIDYTSSMISNGYLFTPAIVQKAISLWHLTEVQITLDGTEDVYNKVKSYVGVKDSPYNRVMNNIGVLLDNGVRVNIRLNLDKHNKEDLYMLVKEIGQRFQERKLLHVYVYVILKDVGFSPIDRTDLDERLLYEHQQKLFKCIDQLGFIKKIHRLPAIELTRCIADSANSIIIYPNGYLYKCEHVFETDWIGTLEEGPIDTEKIQQFEEQLTDDRCINCVLYPSCVRLKKCPVSESDNEFTCNQKVKSYETAIRKQYEELKKVF